MVPLGEIPATTAIRACHDAVAATEIEHAYWLDVRAAGETILSAKLAAQDHQRMLFERARIQAHHDSIDVEYRAFFPEQPDTDDLKAALVKNPNLLAQVMAEATRTYDKAYHYFTGNPGNPTQPPRGRIIEEWNDCRAMLQWAASVPGDVPMGWQERNTIRQIRVCLAISAHFAKYVTLDVEACRRMHEHYANVHAGYQVARAHLPRWVRTGAIAPNSFVAFP